MYTETEHFLNLDESLTRSEMIKRLESAKNHLNNYQVTEQGHRIVKSFVINALSLYIRHIQRLQKTEGFLQKGLILCHLKHKESLDYLSINHLSSIYSSFFTMFDSDAPRQPNIVMISIVNKINSYKDTFTSLLQDIFSDSDDKKEINDPNLKLTNKLQDMANTANSELREYYQEQYKPHKNAVTGIYAAGFFLTAFSAIYSRDPKIFMTSLGLYLYDKAIAEYANFPKIIDTVELAVYRDQRLQNIGENLYKSIPIDATAKVCNLFNRGSNILLGFFGSSFSRLERIYGENSESPKFIL